MRRRASAFVALVALALFPVWLSPTAQASVAALKSAENNYGNQVERSLADARAYARASGGLRKARSVKDIEAVLAAREAALNSLERAAGLGVALFRALESHLEERGSGGPEAEDVDSRARDEVAEIGQSACESNYKLSEGFSVALTPEGNNKVYIIDGNMWIHDGKPFQFDLPSSGAGTRLSMDSLRDTFDPGAMNGILQGLDDEALCKPGSPLLR